jgi:hypothetical protein
LQPNEEDMMSFSKVTARRTMSAALVTAIVFTWVTSSAWAAPLLQQDIAAITSPTEGQSLTGVVTITGSANHPEFDRIELAYGPDPNPNDAWQVFVTSKQPVENGTLGAWNTGIIADGTYMLRLRAVRKDSNYSEAVVRGLKVSNTGPVGTPTSIPPAPTFPAEQPTFSVEQTAIPIPTIMVEQPPTSEPITTSNTIDPASNNATPRRSSGSSSSSSSSSISGSLIGSTCLSGMVLAFGVFAVVGALQFGRYSYKQYRRYKRKMSSH